MWLSKRRALTALRPSLVVLAALPAIAGCTSTQENVCQDIGDCTYGGDNGWIDACKAEANALRDEAAMPMVNCTASYDAYYSCADSNYSCNGATATFPGCDDRLTALDACLAAAPINNCVRLATAEAACAPDAGAGTGADAGAGAPPPACTTARDCQAGCYLGQVTDVCAPAVDELQAFTACAIACPP